MAVAESGGNRPALSGYCHDETVQPRWFRWLMDFRAGVYTQIAGASGWRHAGITKFDLFSSTRSTMAEAHLAQQQKKLDPVR